MKPFTLFLIVAALLVLVVMVLVVALVVALVAVYSAGSFSGPGAGSLELQSKAYWSSMAPFSITTMKASGTTLNLEVVNIEPQRLTLTDIQIDGASVSPAGVPLAFDSGQSKMISAVLPFPCASGTPFTLDNVTIIYTKDGVSGLKESGTKPLVGRCS
jgi:hypothetical protein